MSLAPVRREYRGAPLLESRAPADPLVLLRRWIALAIARGGPEPTAVTLATVDARGRPRARMVLLRDVGGTGCTFFTNHSSAKGRELAANPAAALVLWWPELHRQVRIEGRVRRTSDRDSDAYFAGRLRGAQIAAWASPQSARLPTRAALEARWARFAARFAGRDVPRPPHWGGYRLAPRRIEFWQGRPARLHDRLCYTRRAGGWRRERLAP
jgi:pyridoxamine 5'-phosphate oxidase